MRHAVWILFLALSTAQGQLPDATSGPWQARDTLHIHQEPSADASECLNGLCWTPEPFSVSVQAADGHGDLLVRFPSPRPSGHAGMDLVCMEWHFARTAAGKVKPKARPVVVVHELGSAMAAGRAVAASLSRVGFHAFLIELPTYGHRREDRRPRASELFGPMRQAIADVRRARDAVVSLPTVDPTHVALQGTSLGGMIAASSAGLDGKYDSVFLLLAGGDLFDIVKTGQRDAAAVRRALERDGVTDERLRTMTQTLEPTRIAHRMHPTTTWLYSANYDTVVPMANAELLAKAARLPKDHHLRFNANHYTGMVYLPWVVADMASRVHAITDSAATAVTGSKAAADSVRITPAPAASASSRAAGSRPPVGDPGESRRR